MALRKGSLQGAFLLFGIFVPLVLAVLLVLHYLQAVGVCVCVCVIFPSAFIDVLSRKISLIPATPS